MSDYIKVYELPDGWCWATIEELVDGRFGLFKDGDWIESKDQNPDGEVRLIQLADVGDGEFRNRSNRYMTLDRAEALNCTFLNKGDILVARMPDPLGRACIFPFDELNKFVTVVDVAIIRTNENRVNNKFLQNFINSPVIRKEIERLQTGTTRKRISRSNLGAIKFPIPPINEQNRIVSKVEELFSDLDNGIANLKQAQNQLKVYRQALLKSAFEGKLTEKWRTKNNPEPAEKLMERIKEEREKRFEQELINWKKYGKQWEKDGKKGKKPEKPRTPKVIYEVSVEELNCLPQLAKGWCWISFEQLCTIQRGHDLPINNIKSGEYPVITSGGIAGYHNDFKAKGPALVTGRSGGVGNIHFLNIENYWPHNTVLYVKDFHGNHPKYLFYFFKNFDFKNYSASTAVPTLDRKMLYKIPVPFCNHQEQEQVALELDSKYSLIDNLEQTLEVKLKKSETIRQSILKRAFEGNLVSQDPADEPASDLLKRIQIEKKKYLEEKKEQKKSKPTKTKKMKPSLIEIIEKNFKEKEFTYEQIKHLTEITYDDFKNQLFALLDKGDKLSSRFDEINEQIIYTSK